MPVGSSFDITLNGKGYMLARGQFKGRAWKRMGAPNAVQPRATDSDTQRNALPPELDFVAVYDDFSGGYGDAYRSKTVANRIHWAENMEVRFPGQAVHCQQVQALAGNFTTAPSGNGSAPPDSATTFLQVPSSLDAAGPQPAGPVGRGAIMIGGILNAVGLPSYIETYTPTGLPGVGVNASVSQFNRVAELGLSQAGRPSMTAFAGRPAIFGSFAWIGGDPQSTMPQFRRRDMSGLAGIAMTVSPLNGYTFGLAAGRMWRAHGPSGGHVNLLQSCPLSSDPMGTANWSATLTIGNGITDVQDMVAMDDQLFISTQDGLHVGDISGTFFNVFGDILGGPHPDNGRQLSRHQRGVVYPYTGGVLFYELQRISSNQIITAAHISDIGPQQGSIRSPLKGRFRSIASYAGWLYGGLFTGSSSYLVAGRDRGDGTYTWSPLQRFPNITSNGWDGTAINRLMVDSISTASGGGNLGSGNLQLPPRFWAIMQASFNSLNTNSPLFFWQIPPGDSNPLGQPMFTGNYHGSARMDFGRDTRGAPDTLKVLRRVDVNTDLNTLVSGSVFANIYYALDGGTRQLLGAAQTSPKSTLFFPAAEGSFTTCYDFELSIESFAATANLVTGGFPNPLTPVYRSFVIHGAFLSDGTDQITAVLDMADRRADRQGTPMRSAAAQLSELRSLEGGPPVQLVDLAGAQNWVTVQRSVSEDETYQEGSDEPEVAATVKMSVLKFS